MLLTSKDKFQIQVDILNDDRFKAASASHIRDIAKVVTEQIETFFREYERRKSS